METPSILTVHIIDGFYVEVLSSYYYRVGICWGIFAVSSIASLVINFFDH